MGLSPKIRFIKRDPAQAG